MQALGAATIFSGAAGALKEIFKVAGGGLETGGTMLPALVFAVIYCLLPLTI